MGLFDFFSSKPSPEKFARLAMAALQQAGVQGELNHDVTNFSLTYQSSAAREHTANLHNVYIDYCNASKGNRDVELSRYAQSIVQMQTELPTDFTEVKSRLLPLIRGRMDEMVVQNFLPMTTTSGEPVCVSTPLSIDPMCDIVVQLGYDSPFSIQRISPSQLTTWNVGFDDAMQVATDNLRDRTTDKWETLIPGAFIGSWNDFYDSSRVLLPDCLYRLPLVGDPVVLVPAREALLVTGSRDTAGLAALVAVAEKVLLEKPRHISMNMLRYDGQHWQPFMPEGAAGEQLQRFQREMLAGNYEQQKDALEAQHQKSGNDVFVATFSRFQEKDSTHVFSLATWTEGVDTLLPQVDRVMFVRLNAAHTEAIDSVAVNWHDALELTGSMMEATDYWPSRVRVRTFPDEALFATLKTRRVM